VGVSLGREMRQITAPARQNLGARLLEPGGPFGGLGLATARKLHEGVALERRERRPGKLELRTASADGGRQLRDNLVRIRTWTDAIGSGARAEHNTLDGVDRHFGAGPGGDEQTSLGERKRAPCLERQRNTGDIEPAASRERQEREPDVRLLESELLKRATIIHARAFGIVSRTHRHARSKLSRFLPVFGELERTAAAEVTAVAPASVRISLTDRCDLACVYCRPSRSDGYLPDRLQEPALHTLIEGLLLAGVRRIRFTGGEPLLSPHVVGAVARAAALGAEDIALTTNGTRLQKLAAPLRAAGLKRLTLSLDSLDEQRFERITRGGKLGRVLEGLAEARAVGFDEIKLNTVVLRGENDDELERILLFAWKHGLVPRFIEVMPIAEGARVQDLLVPASEILERLAPWLSDARPAVDPQRGPAKYVKSRHDAGLRVGVISGTTDTYCEGCDRLRVSATGVLRPCLATDRGVGAGAAARTGDPAVIARAVAEAWKLKPDGEVWRGCTEPEASGVSMRAIGG
jgi:GTP 3',8-cyclase